ncbi:restriction endonuclease [Caenimonas sedimenti]|uniref:Restriction endonuclease n=1 Tax=Caenimonas sedimenti TaxID=2596921 RepID=A0A562ZEN4_9BURK|nr:restriction endonuclease [Caenimonas sedimenti]TWO66012.1 restriction endonuclease [Caenimonas sedimenti]
MVKSRPQVTRTFGPIHFEDLDPHRFEDLIRELIYDYKEWQSIEATGRGGSDDGFDIRAYEKVRLESSDVEDDSDTETKIAHPMEGNLWMIQGKREKQIGPTRMKAILAEVSSEKPPYGYILAASASFSKKTYDVFREELRKRGVMEFYLWGSAELEDMLHLPKNDRVLFTFFGVSLVTRRRSRVAELRSSVGAKNKLLRMWGEGHQLHQSLLIRDTADLHYPDREAYSDFKTRPRWKEYIAFGHHPLGLRIHVRDHYAFVDLERKEWDFTPALDLLGRQGGRDTEAEDGNEDGQRESVEGFWKFLPQAKQARFVVDGLLRYDAMTLIDEKGDVAHGMPHIYAEFIGKAGPFAGFWQHLQVRGEEVTLGDEFKRLMVFPKAFPPRRLGKVYKDAPLQFDANTREALKKYEAIDTLYDVENRLAHLQVGDVVLGEPTTDVYLQITNIYKVRADTYRKEHSDFRVQRNMEWQLQRDLQQEVLTVYEVDRIYGWMLERMTANPTEKSGPRKGRS